MEGTQRPDGKFRHEIRTVFMTVGGLTSFVVELIVKSTGRRRYKGKVGLLGGHDR